MLSNIADMNGDVAIIGCGLVGRAWAIVFARAGRRVRLHDGNVDVIAAAPERIAEGLADLQRYGLIEDPAAVLARIVTEADLGSALDGAVYAQESVFERVDAKREIFAAIDRVVGPETLIGSSSSGIPSSAFTADVACRARCLIAHPVNPPHVIPVVELVPGLWDSGGHAKPGWSAYTRAMVPISRRPIRDDLGTRTV